MILDTLNEAKSRLSLSALMVQLGLADHAKKSARCPFHEDASASFSVFTGDDGIEHWKCHAGCGQGDAIDFLAKARILSLGDAIVEFKKLAGLVNTPPAPRSLPSTMNAQPPFDWPASVAAFTPEQAAKLAEWRGYAPKFVAWLHAQNLIGLLGGERIAFPVHEAEGYVVGCHYRLNEDGSWRYYPTGTRTAPLIIGDLAPAKTVFVFESQWDLFAVLDRLDWHQQPPANTAAIATRGASNTRLLAGVCRGDATVYAFTQNDDAGAKWLSGLAAQCGGKCVHVVTPQPHKDVNDWTRAGATTDDLRRAIDAAQLISAPPDSKHLDAPDLHAPPPRNVSKPVITLPDESDEPEAAPFPVDALPPAMAGLIFATSRCAHVPLALPGVCALGVVSAAIGAGLEVISGPDRVTSANLFLLASGESGSGKSESCRPIIAPLIEHQAALLETWKQKTHRDNQAEIARCIAERKVLESKIKKALRPDSPDADELRRLQDKLAYPIARAKELEEQTAPSIIADDFTIEALAMRLRDNRETMFCFSSDARKPIQNLLGRYNPGKTTDESLLLKGYTRESMRVDRAKGDPINLHHPCLALCWFVQPDLLATMLGEESLSASGLLARVLLCHTHADWVKYDRTRQGISDSVRAQWFELVRTLLTTYHDADKPFRIAASPEAEQVLDHYQHSIYDRRGELADVKLFAARWSENAWRVALMLHAALYGVEAHRHPLDGETAANAVRVVQWFEVQQLDILAKGRRQAAAKVEDEVLDLLDDRTNGKRLEKVEREAGQPVDYVTARNLNRQLKTPPDAAKALLDRMERDGLLVGQDITPPHGGKCTRIYRAVKNPVPG